MEMAGWTFLYILIAMTKFCCGIFENGQMDQVLKLTVDNDEHEHC